MGTTSVSGETGRAGGRVVGVSWYEASLIDGATAAVQRGPRGQASRCGARADGLSGPHLSGSAVSSTMVERLNQRDFIMPWGPASVVQCDIMGITSINYRRCSAVFNFLS